MKMYGELFSKPFPEDLAKMPVVAQLVNVLDNEDKTVEFSVPGLSKCGSFPSVKESLERCLTTVGLRS